MTIMNDASGNFMKPLHSNHATSISGISFTSRELDILACMVSGRRIKTIASYLSIAPKTVETHIRNIMLKLDYNSQESVITFIEKSGQLAAVKQHYLSILIKDNFIQSLKEIAQLTSREVCVPIAIYVEEGVKARELTHRLEGHFKKIGITITTQVRQNLIIPEKEDKSLVLYITDRETTLKDANRSVVTGIFLFVSQVKEDTILISHDEMDFIDFRDSSNYYFAFFELLTKLFPALKIESLSASFKKQYDAIQNPNTEAKENILLKGSSALSKNLLSRFSTRKRAYLVASGMGLLTLVIVLLVTISHPLNKALQENNTSSEKLIRSDLPLPIEANLLQRDKVIDAIKEKLRSDKGIETVALVGIGGAGKTTLARQYAATQKTPIVWEINAETKDNLLISFENLAYGLAKNEKEKQMLRAIQEIKNPQEREDKIIIFVKERLRLSPNWLLIYDNVESFSDAMKYFPLDPTTWGQGKIILTTRNINIQGNKHINNVIKIEELNSHQKLTLFNKIMNQEKLQDSSPYSTQDTIKFLEQIPPFPLDISVAAYYLKASNVTYKEYLEHLHQNNKDFREVQSALLKEAGDYVHTRYNIITLSLQRIVNEYPDFESLFLLISLLDSQNIPKGLLTACKNSPIVDKFIYHLKKYSLITGEVSNPIAFVSLHRSTQAVIRAYLINRFDAEKKRLLLQEVHNALIKYITASIDKEDFVRIRNLFNHCEMLLTHKDLLEKDIEASITGELGCLYFYMGDYTKAIQLLTSSLPSLNNNPLVSIQVLFHLGMAYRDLGNYKKSKDTLEECLKIGQTRVPQDHARLAHILIHLGVAHYELDDYITAKDTLTQSLQLCEKHLTHDHVMMATALANLGNVLRGLGEYQSAKKLIDQAYTIYQEHLLQKKLDFSWLLLMSSYLYEDLGDYEKAKKTLEQSLVVTKKTLPDQHIINAWFLASLGSVYKELGEYKKAKGMLDQSLIICRKHLPDMSADFTWPLTYLGKLYETLGEYEQAKVMLEKSYVICKMHLPENHLRLSAVLSRLASVHRELGDYRKAKDLQEESLNYLKRHFHETHIDVMWASVQLGKVYRDLGRYKEAKDLLEHNLPIYQTHYGKEHFETAHVLREIASVELQQDNLIKAEKDLLHSLKIMQNHKHPEQYRSLECLSELYLKKAIVEKNQENVQQFQKFKTQSRNYLMQAQEVVKNYFPEKSPQLISIQEKLSQLNNL